MHTAIREITIENFRGIDHLALSFVGPDGNATDTVVLAGPNGCGKTSVLEACLIAAQHWDKTIVKDGVAHRFPDGSFRPTIKASFDVPDFSRVWTTNRRMPEKFYFLDPEHKSVTMSADIACEYFSSWRAPRLVGPQPITAGNAKKRFKVSEENRLAILKDWLINRKAHAAMRSNGHDAQHLDPNARDYAKVIDGLNAAWRLFHPETEESFSVEPVSNDPDDRFDLYLIGVDGKRVSLDAMSSGELEIINFMGWMLQTGFETGIVFIDEPELHLDPQWHALILQALRRLLPLAQFVVATHSPRIYDSVFSFQRHFLVPADDPRAQEWGISAPAASA